MSAIDEMKELIKEMQNGQTRAMQSMMESMFAKMTESKTTAGMENKKGCEPGQLDEKKNMRSPEAFDGNDKKFQEWKVKMTTYLKVKVPESTNIFKFIYKHQEKSVTDIAMDEMVNDLIIDKRLVENFSTSLHELLLRTTGGSAFEITNSVSDENGLEAWRKITRRYEPRTPGTKRALLMQILNNTSAKRVGDVEANLLHLEKLITRYESMTDEANKLPDEVKATVIIALCHKELRDHLELSTGDMAYDKVRSEIINHVELKRDAIDKNVKQMELDAFRFEYGNTEPEPWYCEEERWSMEEYENNGPPLMEMNAFSKGKGKGKNSYDWSKGGGKGKGQWGNDYSYGGKGGGKGGYKGEAYKGGGKGKGGFQGNCHFCGEFGHSIRNCGKKDKQMQEYRASQGIPENPAYAGKGGLHAVGTEAAPIQSGSPPLNNQSNDIGALERKGGYRFLSQLSTQKPKSLELKNRYGIFETTQEELEPPPGLNLMDFVKPRIDQKKIKESRKTWRRKVSQDEEIKLRTDINPYVPIYLRSPDAKEYVPNRNRSVELNCVEKKCRGVGGTCVPAPAPTCEMFYQSDEELYAEKKRKQIEYYGQVLETSALAHSSDSSTNEYECGVCGDEETNKKVKSCEISAVTKNEIEFTVDTGAEETVCNEDDGADFPIIQGGQESETVYIMPDGRQVKNKGEKHLKVKTDEGGKFIVRTQVTSVRKPLMAVSKVCDEDNSVVFHKDGGYIEHNVTKERTHFKRIGNVYILRLKLIEDETDAPFQRQAR
jgi:hypothetical protein